MSESSSQTLPGSDNLIVNQIRQLCPEYCSGWYAEGWATCLDVGDKTLRVGPIGLRGASGIEVWIMERSTHHRGIVFSREVWTRSGQVTREDGSVSMLPSGTTLRQFLETSLCEALEFLGLSRKEEQVL